MAEFTLMIGNKNYSSWSLRGWLMARIAGIDFEEIVVPLDLPETQAAIRKHSPSGKVPVLIHRGLAVWDSLAIAEYLNDRQAKDKAPVIINLASQEYFKSVDRKALQARVVECVFEDYKGGKYKVISFNAKRARGLMARWAIEHKAKKPEDLLAFDSEGYAYDKAASGPDRLVFRRKLQD